MVTLPASLTNNEVLLYLSGQPVLVKGCNILIYQPRIKDIATAGEEEFLLAAQSVGNIEKLVAPIKKLGKSELEMYSDFQLFLAMTVADENFKNSLDTFFDLIFPLYELHITENEITFSLKENGQTVGMVNPYNFEEFTRIIGNLFLINSDKDEEEVNYDPVNGKAAEIAEKLRAGREKVKEIKKASGETKDIGSLYANYISVLSIGTGVPISYYFDYTPFQLYDAFQRYWAKIGNDLYQKISTTPLMDVSQLEKPEEWSRNLYC